MKTMTFEEKWKTRTCSQEMSDKHFAKVWWHKGKASRQEEIDALKQALSAKDNELLQMEKRLTGQEVVAIVRYRDRHPLNLEFVGELPSVGTKLYAGCPTV